jgi:anti-anti-sigma factor
MKSHIKHRGNVVVIYLGGTINGGRDCEKIQKMVEDLAEVGHRRIIINFSLIRFITTCGIGTLIACKQHIEALGGRIVMCCLDRRPVSVLYKVRLYDYFAITETLDQAIALIENTETVAAEG